MQWFSKKCCSLCTPHLLLYVNILCGLTLDSLRQWLQRPREATDTDALWIRSWPVGMVLRSNKRKQINMNTALEIFLRNPSLTQILHMASRNKFRAKHRNRHMRGFIQGPVAGSDWREVRLASCRRYSLWQWVDFKWFVTVQWRMHRDRQGMASRGGLKNPQECFSIVYTLHQQDVPSGQPQDIFISHGTQVERSVTLMRLTIYGVNLLRFSWKSKRKKGNT